MNPNIVHANFAQCKKGLETGMVWVPKGSFLMGDASGGEFEKPVHEVYLDGFWMDETPVNNDQYLTFIEATAYRTDAEQNGSAWGYLEGKFGLVRGLTWRNYATPDRRSHPVVLVSWNDAIAYAIWAGKRLPTEAEWEKAARGGLSGGLYPWGNRSPDRLHSNFAREPSEVPPTAAVKQFSPNGYGLYDMAGNVWQWCNDWYSENYYSISPLDNPKGPTGGICKIRRGGSWNVMQTFRLRCCNRGAFEPQKAAPNLGFRCVA